MVQILGGKNHCWGQTAKIRSAVCAAATKSSGGPCCCSVRQLSSCSCVTTARRRVPNRSVFGQPSPSLDGMHEILKGTSRAQHRPVVMPDTGCPVEDIRDQLVADRPLTGRTQTHPVPGTSAAMSAEIGSAISGYKPSKHYWSCLK